MQPNATAAAGGTDGREMTLDEWAALDEDEPGELVDGRLEEEEVPDYGHEVCVAWLLRVLGNWLVGKGGFAAGSDAKFAIAPRRGRKPDVTVYLPGGRVPPRRGVVRVPPDIAVEIITSTPRDVRRDRIDKMRDYAAFGVRWYWLLDPDTRTLEVCELRDGLYAWVLGASAGRVEAVPGCDGLALDLDALWAELDRLAAGEG